MTGMMYYNGNKSLRTIDNCQKGSLLHTYEKHDGGVFKTELITLRGRSVVASIHNVLSQRQCNEIINNSTQKEFGSMLGKYRSCQRNNSRSLILDENLASNLWKDLEPEISALMSENNLPFQPLGFDVSRGEWMLYGLNEAFRINQYSSTGNQFFAIHRDAQYCPNGDRRSLLTLLVYLNDDFSGGETTFYLPKDTKDESVSVGKDMIVEDEIKSRGGIEEGYDAFKIEPSVGKAVIFSQNILHESIPVTKKTKFVLKTDIVVKRFDKSYGFAVSEAEKADYLQCLNHFREAQSQELDGNVKIAGELYERALSIRYCYPMAIDLVEFESQNTNDYTYDNFSLPNNVWHHIFYSLSGIDIENVIKAFPGLYFTQKSWELNRCRGKEEYSENQPKHIPSVDSQRGIATKFRFKDAFFFSENEEACVRVAAMYAFYLLGHRVDDQFYTVRYNPETQEVCAISLRSLLTDTFLNRPCFGSVYAVRQQDPSEKNLSVDFDASVDNTYMALRHGAQFLGGAVTDRMRVKVKWLGVSEKAIAKYVQKAIEADDSASPIAMAYDGDKPLNENAYCGENESSFFDNDDNDYNPDGHESADMHYHNRYPRNAVEEKILAVTKENCIKGDASKNEFIWFYEGDARIMPSVPIAIRDVVQFKCLQSNISDCHGFPDCYNNHFDGRGSIVSFCLDGYVDFFNAKELYLNDLSSVCRNEPGVSAAIVTDIKKNTQIAENTMCFCKWPGGDGYTTIYESNSPKCYNHLVFDFSTHKMILTKDQMSSSQSAEKGINESESSVESSDHGRYCTEAWCLFPGPYRYSFFKKNLDGLSNVFSYIVDISPILEDATAFNHASCNCGVPGFEFEECHNIQDYPALDHIHVAGGVKIDTNEVFIWTFYGGIVAL